MQIGQTYTFYFRHDLPYSPLILEPHCFIDDIDKQQSIAFMNTAFTGKFLDIDKHYSTESYKFLIIEDFHSFPFTVKQYLLNNFLNCISQSSQNKSPTTNTYHKNEWVLHAFSDRIDKKYKKYISSVTSMIFPRLAVETGIVQL